ncbi:uncharacterized protein TA20425 [Theileria annulata]|uniref:CS domain-containing protein n=1 Tax=Theileria annulata TaxID=5874 RepID=Q4UH72_THEAN|nr:uncharacterized protein TA20425 [Theileria annulata]CAI73567.1 hypothetical protein, conserved [Theileria annulata]|eukprot:XP_954244.1 hypothetical protein, conserved [Theileria annulata]
MTIDYSKWDKLEVSDDDEESKINVTKLDKNQQVVIQNGGYSIVNKSDNSNSTQLSSNTGSGGNTSRLDLNKEWYKSVLYGIVTVNSHIFTQDRYEVNFLLLINFDYLKLQVKLDECSIKVYNVKSSNDFSCLEGNFDKSAELILSKEFYSKIKEDENFWNWEIVTLDIDWEALKSFSNSVNKDKNSQCSLYFTKVERRKFIKVNVHKHVDIQDCFIWWPKLFKDDLEEIKVVDNSEFSKVWDKAHEEFKRKISKFDKIPI